MKTFGGMESYAVFFNKAILLKVQIGDNMSVSMMGEMQNTLQQTFCITST
jgi:hypothetical protein